MSGEKKNLVNHGWQQMVEVLDQEMPIEKNKRRVLWLPILGILIVLLVSIYFFGSNNFSNKGIENKSIENIEGLEFKNQDYPIAREEIKTDNNPESMSDELDVDLSKTNDLQNSENAKIILETNRGAYASNIIQSEKNQIDYPGSDQNIISSKDQSVEKNSSFSLQEESDYEENASSFIVDRSSFSALNSMNSLNINLLKTQYLITEPNIHEIINPKKSELGLTSKIALRGDRILNRNTNLFGVEYGLSKQMASHWEINGVLAFAKSLRTKLITNDQSPNMDIDLSSGTVPEFDDSFVSSSATASPTIHLAELSLRIGYYLNPKLSLYTGLNGGLHWGEIFSSMGKNTSGVRTSEPSSTDYKSWNYGIQAGMKYNLSNHLIVGLQFSLYNHPLLTGSEEEQLRLLPSEPVSRQMAGLNISYRF